MPETKPSKALVRQVVMRAFLACHEGRSTDDVVIDDRLNSRFLSACQQELPSLDKFTCNWALYNLRKSAGLGAISTAKQRAKHADYLHAAEIAARRMEDKYGLTIDRVLCHPERRLEFDTAAQAVCPGTPTYLLRKAALRLRKGRLLRPELIKRVADWGKVVSAHTAGQLLEDPELIPRRPGIYIFSDPSGFLYIGEAENLRLRVAKHLDHSDRKALARYLWEVGVKGLTVELHAFEPNSDGRKAACRKAYEAELIRTRQPKFNIQGQE